MKYVLVLAVVLMVAACVRVSLQPPTPEWADWCIKNGGELKHMYGPVWVCDLSGDDGSA